MKAFLYKARDVMKDPITISVNTRLSEVINRILNEGIGALIVTDNDKLVGIVTKRDLLWAVSRGLDFEKETIDKIMSKNLITVEPDADLSIVINRMIENNISHLPVVENGKLVGIISDRDLVELLNEVIEFITTSREESGE